MLKPLAILTRRIRAATFASVVITLAGCADCGDPKPAIDLHGEIEKPGLALYTVEYARSRDVPTRKLIDKGRGKLNMSWYFHVLVGDGRVTLIDTGTSVMADPEGKERKAWKVQKGVTFEQALAGVGLKPKDVTHVLLTHAHWDHTDGLAQLDHTRVFAQRGEWEKLLGNPKRARGRAAAKIAKAGHAAPFDATPFSPLPGIEARETGKHTEHHTAYVVTCRGGRKIAVGGDGAYLYRNLEKGVPIAVSTSPQDNVRDMAALMKEFGASNVLPGHDPALFSRFKRLSAKGSMPVVARICP